MMELVHVEGDFMPPMPMTGGQLTVEEVEDVGTVVAMDNPEVAVEDYVVIEAEEIAEVASVETKASEVVEEAIAVVVAI